MPLSVLRYFQGKVLSEQLEKHRDDYETAFAEYEKSLRPMIEKMQKKAVNNSATFVPTSRFTLWIRNIFAPLIFKKIFSGLLIKQLGADNYFEKNNGS